MEPCGKVVVVLADFVLDFDRDVGVVGGASDEGQDGRAADRDRRRAACLLRAAGENGHHQDSHKAVMYFRIGLGDPCERGDQNELIDPMAGVRDRDEDNGVVDVQMSHSETRAWMALTTNSGRIRQRQQQRQRQR